MEERIAIAKKIVEMVEQLEAGKLKRTARDYISGMIAAYGILIDVDDHNAAYAQAKLDALK